VPKRLVPFLAGVRDRGCAILIVMLMTLPLWMISIAYRGPRFAIGTLILLGLVVFGLAWLNRFLGDRRA
jgi:hypothetical protein